MIPGRWGGYGVSLKAYNALFPVFGLRIPSSSAYTSVQYAYALFPNTAIQTYTVDTERSKSPDHTGAFDRTAITAVHFTPLWYPDGSYTVKVLSLTAGRLTA